jgi:hypothetical protein
MLSFSTNAEEGIHDLSLSAFECTKGHEEGSVDTAGAGMQPAFTRVLTEASIFSSRTARCPRLERPIDEIMGWLCSPEVDTPDPPTT